jgi:hypothetical protein
MEKFPNNHSEIKHIFADGDYVIVHDHAVREPGTRRFAIVNIYKLENGQGGRALGRHSTDPGEGRKQQRNVLGRADEVIE